LNRPRLETVLSAAASVTFVVQFALLDAALRGPRAWIGSARAALGVVASVLVWTLLLALARTRGAKAIVALVAAVLVVVQAMVFHFYRTPLDVQVAASALHAWRDVEPILMRVAPQLILAVVAVFLAEMALLAVARGAAIRPRSRRARVAVVGAVALVLVFVSPREATPDITGVYALTAVAHARTPARASSSRADELPEVHSTREALPNVLLVLTESVRAEDYVKEGAGATARESAAALAAFSRVDLREMRAVSSYTALSLSALVSGRSQEAAREEILRSPSIFDFARAAVDAGGQRSFVAIYSSQAADIFETKDVHRSVDRFISVETLLGRPVGDESSLDGLPLDRQIVDRFVADLPSLGPGAFTMLHLYATHAPYYFEDGRAEFVPFARVVAWSKMTELRNAYRNSIVEQDREVARAVRAFIEHSGSRPWLVVFTSDHGEAFGEHGAIHHGQNLYDEQIHVPGWIAFGAGVLDAEQERALREHESRSVTHVDVVPTLLDALGVWDNLALRPSRQRMTGKSLLQPWAPRPAVPLTNCTGMFPCPLDTWGVLGADHKLVAQRWDADWFCLDLTGPGERVAAPDDPACKRLRDDSRAFFPRMPNGKANR
jgi:glucan phosphoethanolaminetransferase (alkaline phosphatase superfamily)